MGSDDTSDQRSSEILAESLSDAERKAITAVHEAAHSVFLVLFGLGTRGVSIEANQSFAGFALGPNQELHDSSRPDGFFQMQKHIIMLLSGAEAVKQILPEFGELPQGDESDIKEAEIVLDRMIEEYHPSFDNVTLEFYREVTRNHLGDLRVKSIVVDLANTLRDRTSLTGHEVEAFVEEKVKEIFGGFYRLLVET